MLDRHPAVNLHPTMIDTASISGNAPSFQSEEAEFLDFHGEQLYIVLHRAVLPLRGLILLAGPFASERTHRYIPWVRWARYLACHGFEVLRFDYRGVGESTGRFEDFGFRCWQDDLCFCADWLQQRHVGVPLVLHGLGMGALLADRLFAEATGNAMLAWLPPKSARDMLYEQLKIKLANNFVLPANQRKTRDQLVRDLENGETVEVEGHNWTPRLWAEAGEFVFGKSPVASAQGKLQRIHVATLDPLAAHTLGGVGPNPLRTATAGHTMRLVNPDLSASFDDSVRWIKQTLTEQGAAKNA